jgi:hypothetical protein
MGFDPQEPVSEGLYPRGFRKTIALLLFFVMTTMPTVFSWQNPPTSPAASNSSGINSFEPFPGPPSRHFNHRPFGAAQQATPPSRGWAYLLSSFLQLSLATIGGAFSLALYYPRSGFKRFALLCGPLVGLGTMFTLGLYLAARSEVYRFEICFASLVGAAPGLALYVLLVSWKANRLAQAFAVQPAFAAEQVYSAEPMGPGPAVPPVYYPRSSTVRK